MTRSRWPTSAPQRSSWCASRAGGAGATTSMKLPNLKMILANREKARSFSIHD
jgi:hypothetical protein